MHDKNDLRSNVAHSCYNTPWGKNVHLNPHWISQVCVLDNLIPLRILNHNWSSNVLRVMDFPIPFYQLSHQISYARIKNCTQRHIQMLYVITLTGHLHHAIPRLNYS